MSIIKRGEGEKVGQKRTFPSRVKKLGENLCDFLVWDYHNDEIGVDTRNQGDRYLQKTWEMYHLEQKRNKEEAEKYGKKFKKLDTEYKEYLNNL